MSTKAFMGAAIVAASFLATSVTPRSALAAGALLELQPFKKRKLILDGWHRDWPSGFAAIEEVVKGSGPGPDVEGAVGYDDEFIYVALDVKDPSRVQTRAMSSREDHGQLLLAFPTKATGRHVTTTVRLFPGQTGKFGGAVKIAGRKVKGADVVAAPKGKGFTLEAKIPWTAFPQASKVRVGLKGDLRYHDANPGKGSVVVGTKSGSLPSLPIDAEQGLAITLLQKHQSAEPSVVLFGNVTGDRQWEKVEFHGQVMTITGFNYRGGSQFYYADLGGDGIAGARLLDFDGDGLLDIAFQRRVGQDLKKYREYVQIYRLEGDVPKPLFAHEVTVASGAGKVQNGVTYSTKGGKAVVVVSVGQTEGFTGSSYQEPPASDVPGALKPWESVGSRTFGWDGASFGKLSETSRKPTDAGSGTPPPRIVQKGAPPPPPMRPPSPGELQTKVYDLYKQHRKLPKNAKARFDFVTDVAEDGTPERVVVHGRDIVVFGKSFLGGARFIYSSLLVADEKDLLSVTTRDLTGDGKAEVILSGVVHAKTGDTLGNKVVHRYVTLVFKVQDGKLNRIFAAESGRALGSDRVIGAMAFRAADKGLSIDLMPGRAVNWTKKSYPFQQDSEARDGLEPLILPWSDATRRYVFDGSQFTAQ